MRAISGTRRSASDVVSGEVQSQVLTPMRSRGSMRCIDFDQLVTIALPFFLGGLFPKLGEHLQQIGNLTCLSRLAQRLYQAIERGLVLGIALQAFPTLLNRLR